MSEKLCETFDDFLTHLQVTLIRDFLFLITGRERKTCLKKLMNYRKTRLGRRAMSEEAEGYGYPFNAFYSFEDTSSGLPSPCEDDQEFEGEDEVFSSNCHDHLSNGYTEETPGDEQVNENGDDQSPTTTSASPQTEEQDVECPPPSTTVTTTNHTINHDDASEVTPPGIPTKVEYMANGQAQPVMMGPEKPVDVGVASKGRFGALSQTKESTYNGVVNICHYRSTKGSASDEEKE